MGQIQAPDYRPALLAKLRANRRAAGATSLQFFARTYLPHHFRATPSEMHLDLFSLLEHVSTTDRPNRIAVAAPRGHAKSTLVSIAGVLWSLLYGKEPFVLLVSANRELAISHLKTIRTELENNPHLIQDFPEACLTPERRHLARPWKDNQLVLPSGCALRALGAEQRMRGMKHNQHRPTLIVVDDLEDQEHVNTAEGRQTLRDWFEGTLLKMSGPSTNVVVVGTILHCDSLLANLTGAYTTPGQPRISGWQGSVYRAVISHSARPELWERWESYFTTREQYKGRTGPAAARQFFEEHQAKMLEGTEVLWEDIDPYERLMVMRLTEGARSFQAEKMNQPLDPALCLFKEESFHYWDEEFRGVQEMIRHFGGFPRIFGACDPSMGRQGGDSDFSAIVTLIEDPKSKVLYVADADIARRSPDQTIKRIIELAKIYRYRDMGFEVNGFQELMLRTLRDRAADAGVRLPLREVKQSADKKGRIETLEPLIAQGRIRFSRRQQMLLDQLRQFPLGAHDDGPDALEMGVGVAIKGSWEAGWVLDPFRS